MSTVWRNSPEDRHTTYLRNICRLPRNLYGVSSRKRMLTHAPVTSHIIALTNMNARHSCARTEQEVIGTAHPAARHCPTSSASLEGTGPVAWQTRHTCIHMHTHLSALGPSCSLFNDAFSVTQTI